MTDFNVTYFIVSPENSIRSFVVNVSKKSNFLERMNDEEEKIAKRLFIVQDLLEVLYLGTGISDKDSGRFSSTLVKQMVSMDRGGR